MDMDPVILKIRDVDKSLVKTAAFFEKRGSLWLLKPEWELPFLHVLVKTHPPDKKNFEHVLIDPPDGILPSDVLFMLQTRDAHIPDLLVVTINQKKEAVAVRACRNQVEWRRVKEGKTEW